MMERFSSNLGTRLGFPSWPALLIGIVFVRAVLPLAVKPDSFLFSWSAISYFLLLLLAASFAIRNAIQNTLGTRPFWVALAIAYGLWALDQSIFLYYEHRLHIDVPDDSMADSLLFLHLLPLMAAVATLPNRGLHGRKLYRAILTSLLLLFFWSFLYVYAVFPYQYLFSSGTSYALRFDSLYLLENVTLVLIVAIQGFRARGPWKTIYFHLFGACTLYALSSAVANFAIDSGGYVDGKLYGLGLIASACWFVWIPLRTRQVAGIEVEVPQPEAGPGSKASAWAMLLVVMISIPVVWELFRRDEAPGMRRFRLLVAVAAIVCLAGAAYINEYLAKSELALRVGLANDRLRLAVEAGKAVGWEWDLKTGRDSWFGDLHTMFGISSDTFVGRPEDFYRYVHPEDRQLVATEVADAKKRRVPYAAEFRVVRIDGTVRWVAAKGKFYYSGDGVAERMLGMAVDITEKRHAEESLRLFRKLIDESNDAIEVVDPETLRFLDVNERACYELGYTREELLSLRVFDIDPTLDESLLTCHQKEIKKSGSVLFDTVHRRKNGSTYPVEINLKRVQLDRTYDVNIVRDMTERKRVEEALLQKDEELTDAQRVAEVGSWEWNPESGAVTWSEELYRIAARDPNLPALPFGEHSRLFTPESWERLRHVVDETLRTGASYELDLEMIRPDGTTRWVRARGEARATVGRGTRLVGTAQDITARKHAEEALRESEERFHLAAQAGKMFAYEWDAATDAILYSAEAVEILGIDETAQLTGQQSLARVHSDDRERLVAAIASLTAEQPDLRVSYRLVRPDNDVIWLERTSRAHFDEQGKMLRIVGMVTDITERKRVEEALERSDSNYRMFVAQSSEGIFCQELKRPISVELPEDEQVQRILHESYLAECNDAMARMYGMSPADFVGKPLTETLDADDPVNIELTRDYIRSGYRVVDRESREVDPQGNPKAILNSMIGIVENNMLLRTWGIQRDITDRRQAEQARMKAEQALRESEQRLRLATQAGKMYAYEWDVASDIVVRSQENASVLGFSDPVQQLTRQQIVNRVHPDDRAKFISVVADLTLEKPTIQISYRVLRPDGAVIWVEKSARAFFDEQGKISRMIGMVADITERKRAEGALRESEAYLAEAQRLTHTGSGAWRVPGGDALYLSDEWYRIYDFDPKQGLSAWNDRLLRVHPEDRAKLRERKDRAVREKSGYEVDHRIVLPDGTVKYTHTVGHPVLNASGDVEQFVFTMMDVTERKRAEEALSSMSRRLIEAQEVERTRIARELHDDLGQRLSLLANELEQLHQDASTTPEVGGRVSTLQKHATQLAMDIQTLSHELHSSKLELLGIAAAMRGFCQEFGEQTKVKIDFKSQDLPSPLPPDISLCLFRVLQEALHNSVKHGRVRHVEVRLWGMSDQIHLAVSDSGAGFDSEAAKQSGGLGLVSMEERLKLVKGTLSIESQLKRGTTIHARVPLSSGSDSMRAAG